MDVRLNLQLLGSSNAAISRSGPEVARAYAPQKNVEASQSAPASNVSLSTQNIAPSGTRITSESQEVLQNGTYRRTRTFEREDGRQFLRIEDLQTTPRGAIKTVIQQNPSGGLTRYEEVLDRETGGTFRRTQRFQDEGGNITTNITNNVTVTDPFVLGGGGTGTGAAQAFTPPSPFDPFRGTQLDIQA